VTPKEEGKKVAFLNVRINLSNPQPLTSLAGKKFRGISTWYNFVLAVTEEGKVLPWGQTGKFTEAGIGRIWWER
jgi:hypothetical protein